MRMYARFSALFAAAACFVPSGPAAAQVGFGFPSCIASVVSGPGTPINRLIPAEAPPQLARQVRGVVARAVTWRPGQTIRVCFKSGTRAAQDRVIRVANEWMSHANVLFDFQEGGAPRRCRGDEDVKIDFVDNRGWWSAYGTISRHRDPSMNLQFLGVDAPRYPNGQPMPDAEMRRVILHEFGHALGMMHEHQSPAGGCDTEINWDEAYKMGAKLGWDREMVHAQMRQLTSTEEFNVTAVDRKSIMHYSLAPELFKVGRNSRCWIPENYDLSELDKRFIASVYPRSGGPPIVTSSAPQKPAAGAIPTRGAKPPAAMLNDKETLVRQYEDLLRQAGIAADRIAQLSKDFRKNVFGQ
jgi:hypothetical protein